MDDDELTDADLDFNLDEVERSKIINEQSGPTLGQSSVFDPTLTDNERNDLEWAGGNDKE